ncbi:MAG: hypothetical protein HYS07_04565 [Chlamydiae bacterium]|nr:hypothetical protein [Chlamydiota bacterium]MBI3276162.1 hypothetical protein [Chlamydiota bacterium]
MGRLQNEPHLYIKEDWKRLLDQVIFRFNKRLKAEILEGNEAKFHLHSPLPLTVWTGLHTV